MSRPKFPVSVVILTKNEEANLPGCLASLSFSDDIVVYDSYSTDKTVEIAQANPNTRVIQRKFDNWSAHQNWGVQNIPFKHPWVLYMDADEHVDAELRDEVQYRADPNAPQSAFRIRRKDMFMGRFLKRAQVYPTWLVRLFRPSKIRYERLVNPIAVVDGPTAEMNGHIIHYPFSKGVAQWFERHNSYSTFEATELGKVLDGQRAPFKDLFSSDPNKRRAVMKDIFYRLPMRPHVKYFYYVFVRRAFLDGAPGMMYARMQFIYEAQISIKRREQEYIRSGKQL